MSNMRDGAGGALSRVIASRVRRLRAANRMSLETLAATSGVSRSMISLIERGESSPTAVVLEKLAKALGVVLASLFEPVEGRPPARGPVARRTDQAVWVDPASGYRRRNVSPPDSGQPLRIIEVQFPAGAHVTFDESGRDQPVHQQVWILDGAMTITVGRTRHALEKGDCLAMALDRPISFDNPTRKTARYAVVIATGGRRSRS